MIQDRLTAKFQSAKPVTRRDTTAKPAVKPKAKTASAATTYLRNRAASGSFFWL